jgi:hypothetical protein
LGQGLLVHGGLRGGDEDFARMVIDTLRVERPAYRELHAWATTHHWLE